MDLFCCSKWPSSLGFDHGRLVNPIIHDILPSHINTLLETIFNQRGEEEGHPNKGCVIKILHKKSSLIQQVLQNFTTKYFEM
jgi:hypothetical protein